MTLPKTYDPAAAEAARYADWEASGAFSADPAKNAYPYVIMMPPPNVTGSLHMGHGLTFTLQDILIRYARMQGKDTLWQPGTDHAGIATQMVVERMLEGEGVNRRDIGRDKFLERVWAWKDESGGAILKQLRRLGASADWPRERFTMDAGLSDAVRKVFIDLYDQGLIYKDQRLVNWDPKLETAISDLEVQPQEVNGHLWHFRYPIEGAADEFIVVATTRPETMLGDTGVAVNPEDERYRHLVGKHCILPLVGRRIPIVADDYADPEAGSGAVKMTPAHDFNDFEVGRRHNLETINILDRRGFINENAPEKYQGMDRFAARKVVVDDMEALGLLEKVAPHVHMVPYGDRGGVPIEPYLTEQWYVDAETLARPAIEAVETGRTKFVPENWSKTYFEWMRNIQPWCISRQLWWGHRIPAWYGPDGTIFVAEDAAAAQAKADAHYGAVKPLEQDPDVLDTWFSSALWPFSTIGWPEETPELAKYYPGDVLVTGFDIIFFWVARMMMMGLHFMKDVPFRTVYIHALVRDEKGQKMSKSKGNVIDPLELIDEFGADAVRFTLAAMAAQGRDIKLSASRVEGYRNFATKLWNAARFTEFHDCAVDPDFDPAACTVTLNRWIVAKTAALRDDMTRALDDYRFNEAAGLLYQFAWGTFCDWQLEFAKPILSGKDRAAAAETRAAIAWTLARLMRLLHPIMPYLTEEIAAERNLNGGALLIGAEWPPHEPHLAAPEAEAEIDWAIRFVTNVRAVRAECNVPPGARINATLAGASEATLARLARNDEPVKRLTRLTAIQPMAGAAAPKGAVQVIVDEATVFLPLGDVIDVGEETARLEKEIAKVAKEIDGIDKRLGNPKFTARAPEEVVEENRERRAAFVQQQDKLTAALARLRAA